MTRYRKHSVGHSGGRLWRKRRGAKVTRTLTVQWKDGFYTLGQERSGMEGAAKVMAAQIDPDLPIAGRIPED